MQTLAEIIDGALSRNSAGVKVASLRDAPVEDRAFTRLDTYLATELGQLEVETPKTAADKTKVAAQVGSDGLDDVHYALKLAEALAYGETVIAKLADGNVELYPQPLENAKVVSPKPQASSTARGYDWATSRELKDGKPKDDEHAMMNGGPVIPAEYKGPDKKASREQAERMLRSKKAQHQALVSLGQIDAAQDALKEAAEIEASLKTDDSLGTHFPDNEGVRNLTKAQARDVNQRQAASFFGEPVKNDNAVAAHTMTDVGLKLSSVPYAKVALYEGMARNEGKSRASTGAQGTLGGIGGGIAGGVAGAGLGAHRALKKTIATHGTGGASEAVVNTFKNHMGSGKTKAVIGGLAAGGAVLGALHGRARAKGEQKWQSSLQGKTASDGGDDDAPDGTAEENARGRRRGQILGAVAGGAVGGNLGARAHRLSPHLSPKARLGVSIAGGAAGALMGGAAGAKGMKHLQKKLPLKDREKEAEEEKLAFVGGVLKAVGDKVVGAGVKGLGASVGAASKLKAVPGGMLARGIDKGVAGAAHAERALTGLGATGRKVVGGAALGGGALLAGKAVGMGGER